MRLIKLLECIQVSFSATFEKLVLPLRGGRRDFRLAQPDLLLVGEVKQIALPGPAAPGSPVSLLDARAGRTV